MRRRKEPGTKVHITGPTKTDFESEKYTIILDLLGTILYTKSQILFTLPSCAIRNWNLGAGDMQPPQKQLQHKKLDHNFVLILYNFVHQVPNFQHHSFYRFPNLRGWRHAAPPKCSFKIKNWIIILYSFCKILNTKSQILYTYAIQILVVGDKQPHPHQMQFQNKKLDHNFVLILYNFVHKVPN